MIMRACFRLAYIAIVDCESMPRCGSINRSHLIYACRLSSTKLQMYFNSPYPSLRDGDSITRMHVDASKIVNHRCVCTAQVQRRAKSASRIIKIVAIIN